MIGHVEEMAQINRTALLHDHGKACFQPACGYGRKRLIAKHALQIADFSARYAFPSVKLRLNLIGGCVGDGGLGLRPDNALHQRPDGIAALVIQTRYRAERR